MHEFVGCQAPRLGVQLLKAPGEVVGRVTPDSVVLDRNHPLAGQKVRFDVEVLEVRPAQEDEISAAEAALGGPQAPDPGLIPAARLLRGGTRRYEKDPSGALGRPTTVNRCPSPIL